MEEVPNAMDLLRQFTSKSSHRASGARQHPTQAPTGSDKDDDEVAIEAILAHSYDDGRKYYLVKWAGYKDAEDWVIDTDLAGAREMVEEYETRLRRKRK